MLTKIKNLSKITTILKVVLCILFVFFSSCSKFEEEQEQTNIVPNINEAQAIIGKENWYENYVNIEDFKGVQVEDNVTYQKHQKAQERLLAYETFPNAKSEKDLEELSENVAFIHKYFSDSLNVDWYHLGYSYYSFDDDYSSVTEQDVITSKINIVPAIECFYYSEQEGDKIKLLTPKEAYELPLKLRDSLKNNKIFYREGGYSMGYCSLSAYSKHTGIPKSIFNNLRIFSKPVLKTDTYEKSKADKVEYFYQMPYKDNYKDYQNDTKKVENFDNLKRFIKKGSLIFIFDKHLDKLESKGLNNWGHMMIVGNWYTKNINKYQMLSYYKTFQKNEDVKDIQYLLKNKFDSFISFTDYLKHFVFIEAQKDITNNINRMQGFEYNSGVMLTAGNDERLLKYIKNATCIAVVNINDGYQMSHPDLVDNMINFAYRQRGNPYNIKPSEDDLFTNHYCSGLVWYSFNNQNLNPSLKLLLPKHRTSPIYYWGYWYMPRTICNSPYVYTRVWYKKE